MSKPTRYDWDPVKRLTNAAKHRLDFEDAWLVLESPVCWDQPTWLEEGDQRRFRRASRREREEYGAYLDEVGQRDE